MQHNLFRNFLFTLLALSSLLFSNTLPSTISTTVSTITSNGQIQLSSSVPQGMSGIVIHNYGNGLSAITHASISQGEGKAEVTSYEAIPHDNIPNIQTAVTKGDKVVFGSFYENAMVIAPNRDIYRKITTSYKKTWIHPDAYALYFMKEEETKLTLESLKKFAQLNQVGLVLIVSLKNILILDPISKIFLGTIPMQVNPKNVMVPFYARFKQTDISTFGFSKKSYTPYFQSVAGLK